MLSCKYSLIRYVPDPIRQEPVNIGLILHEPNAQFIACAWDLRRAASRLTGPDRQTIKHYRQQLETIENEEREWHRATFESIPVREPDFLERLSDYIGNSIRFEPPRGCVTKDPDGIFDELFERFISKRTTAQQRVTKRTLIKSVKQAFDKRDMGRYLAKKPTVQGEHGSYTVPLAIYHSHKRFIDVLNLNPELQTSLRIMAGVARLWSDARRLAVNRSAEFFVLLHYQNAARLREGERLLMDDGLEVRHRPPDVLEGIDFNKVRQWA